MPAVMINGVPLSEISEEDLDRKVGADTDSDFQYRAQMRRYREAHKLEVDQGARSPQGSVSRRPHRRKG